jgi:hypothetical protein
MQMNVSCLSCGYKETIGVTHGQYFQWAYGEMIQNAFPELTPDQRELILTGTCGKCFDEMFGES